MKKRMFYGSILLFFVVKLFSAEDVFISISQYPQSFIKTPANTSVITSKDIEKLNAKNISEVLSLKKGLFVKDMLSNGKFEVDLRGFGEKGASNVLVLLNGKRLNNIDTTNVDWTQIPTNIIEKIEIIYGQGAVLYGDNATAAIVNIITKPTTIDETSLSLLGGSYQTYNLFLNINKNLKENIFFNTNIAKYYTNGFRENNEINNFSLYLGLLTKINNTLTIDTKLDTHKMDYGLPGSIDYNDYKFGNITKSNNILDNGAKPYDLGLQLNLNSKLSDISNINLEIYKKAIKQETDFTTWNYYDTRYTNTTQMIIRNTNKSYLFNKENILNLGIDLFSSNYLVNEYLSSNRSNEYQSTLISRDSFAGYIQNNYNFLDNINVSLGFRGENINNKFEDRTNKKEETLNSLVNSYEFAVSWIYQNILNLNFNFSNSYRLPKTDEYFSVYTGLNKNLKTQINKQYSINTKYLFDNSNNILFTVYSIFSENEIFFNPFTFSNENYEKTSHQGIEIEINNKISDYLDTSLAYSFNDSKIKSGEFDGNSIPLVPNNILSSSFNFNIDEDIYFLIVGKYVSSRKLLNDIKGLNDTIKEHTIFDTKLSYKISPMKFTFSINNIFNTKYATAGGVSGSTIKYYPGMPRNYSISVDYTF